MWEDDGQWIYEYEVKVCNVVGKQKSKVMWKSTTELKRVIYFGGGERFNVSVR